MKIKQPIWKWFLKNVIWDTYYKTYWNSEKNKKKSNLI